MKRCRIIPTKETIERELESDIRIKALWLKMNEDEVRFVCKVRDFYNKTFVKELQKRLGIQVPINQIYLKRKVFIEGLSKFFPHIEMVTHIQNNLPIFKFKHEDKNIESIYLLFDNFDSNNWTRLCIELITQGFHPNSLGQKTF